MIRKHLRSAWAEHWIVRHSRDDRVSDLVRSESLDAHPFACANDDTVVTVLVVAIADSCHEFLALGPKLSDGVLGAEQELTGESDE